MRFLQFGRDQTLEYYAPERADSCTIEVITGDGTILVVTHSACVIDTVNTILSGTTSVLAGQRYCNVSSSTGVTKNRLYQLQHATNGQSEFITVASSSGNDVFFKFPVQNGYPAASLFKSTRIEFVLSKSLTTGSTTGYNDCVAIFSPVISSVSQSDGRIDFSLCKHPPQSMVTSQNLLELEPNLLQKLNNTTRIQDVIATSFDQLLDLLSAGDTPAGEIWSNTGLKQAHIYLTLYNLSLQYGPQFAAEQEKLYKIFERELGVLKSNVKVDENQDGIIEKWDRFPSGIRLIRS